MDNDISGFVGPVTPYGGADLSTFTLLHCPEEGFFALYRGERAGQFRVYKCLKPKWRGAPLQEAMLKKEFELGYPLRHPNIRETYQYTSIEGLGNCIEMEWVDGAPLDEYLRRTRPDRKKFIQLASELCDALSYMHSRQTVHRDLKPGNIMVTHDGGNIKIIDFGLADSSSSALLKAPAGSRRYMSPEVAAGMPADTRSDIWSLGVVLGEMAGRRGYVVRRCTRNDPSRRFCDAASVKEAVIAEYRRPRILFYTAAALIVAAAVVFSIVRGGTGATQEEGTRPDTVRVIVPAPEQQEPRPQQEPLPARTARPKPAAEKSDAPDRIFQQASDLFEEKL